MKNGINQTEYIEANYGTQKLKRGRWRIILYGGHDPDEVHDLWHQCSKTGWDMYTVEYVTEAYDDRSLSGYRKIKPNWHCRYCFAVPPASIVTVWCLLEPDRTSEEVIDTLQAAQELEEDIRPGGSRDSIPILQQIIQHRMKRKKT